MESKKKKKRSQNNIPSTTLPNVHQHLRTSTWLADITPPLTLPSQSSDIFDCSGAHTPGALFWTQPTKAPSLSEDQTMAIHASMRYCLFDRRNSSAVLRKLVLCVNGNIQRLYSSATRKENEVELGDSTLSAPNFVSSLKSRSTKVPDKTLPTKTYSTFHSECVNTGSSLDFLSHVS